MDDETLPYIRQLLDFSQCLDQKDLWFEDANGGWIRVLCTPGPHWLVKATCGLPTFLPHVPFEFRGRVVCAHPKAVGERTALLFICNSVKMVGPSPIIRLMCLQHLCISVKEWLRWSHIRQTWIEAVVSSRHVYSQPRQWDRV